MGPCEGKHGGTCERLLEAAVSVFAEKGYHEATVAEICEAAGANIAAINYHFGSKENLYVESWRHSLAQSLEAYPPDGGVPPEAPADQRLRGRMWALLERAMDENCAEFEIMGREMASPTGLLFKVLHESIAPLREAFRLVIEELLGPKVPEHVVELCTLNVSAPCIHMVHRRRMFKFLGHEVEDDTGDFEETVEHMAQFALGGIATIREQYESASSTALEDSCDD